MTSILRRWRNSSAPIIPLWWSRRSALIWKLISVPSCSALQKCHCVLSRLLSWTCWCRRTSSEPNTPKSWPQHPYPLKGRNATCLNSDPLCAVPTAVCGRERQKPAGVSWQKNGKHWKTSSTSWCRCVTLWHSNWAMRISSAWAMTACCAAITMKKVPHFTGSKSGFIWYPWLPE